MQRFRNMNAQQQGRVQNQTQSGNFGQGAAGQVAQRRAAAQAGRINTTPALVTDPAPAPQPAQQPAAPAVPQQPMERPQAMQNTAMQKMGSAPMGQSQPMTQWPMAMDRSQMAGQAVDQMRAKMPSFQPQGMGAPAPQQQVQGQFQQPGQFQPMQKRMGQY